MKKEIKISFIKSKINHNDIKEVCCDSKSLFNKSMLFLSLLFAFLIGKILYFDLISKEANYDFTNIISILGILLLTITPSIYYIFKMMNFKFYINNEKLNYKNIFGKTFSYSLTEILKAEYFPSLDESIVDSIVIKFVDKRRVKISSTDRNFELLKSFLISKNLLVK